MRPIQNVPYPPYKIKTKKNQTAFRSVVMGVGWVLILLFVVASMAAIVMSMSGCASTSPGYLHVDSIKPAADRVFDRHDDYVRADGTLTQNERETFLRSTTLLRSVMEEASSR